MGASRLPTRSPVFSMAFVGGSGALLGSSSGSLPNCRSQMLEKANIDQSNDVTGATRKGCFFFQAWPPLNRVKRKRERQKKGLDYTKKLVDVLHIPGKNQSVSIRSLHFLSTAPNLFNFNSFSCPSFQSSFFPPLHLNNHGLFQSVEKKKSQKSELIKHTQHHTQTQTQPHW